MKKIIDGKMYDTETAQYICGYNTEDKNDPDYKEEHLYRKKNGEFFVKGCGGKDTEYAYKGGLCEYRYYCPNFDYQIRPFEEYEAKEFVEAIGDAETYIRLFGEVEE